jgi:hypothetical protein
MSEQEVNEGNAASANLQMLVSTLDKLSRQTVVTDSKVSRIQSIKYVADEDYARMRAGYDLWSKNESRIPLRAYWAAFCLLGLASYFGPGMVSHIWVLGLVLATSETYARNAHREGYRYGFEYGVSSAANRAVAVLEDQNKSGEPVTPRPTPVARHTGFLA